MASEATMVNQGKNIFQAEIDAPAETADFFRQYVQEAYRMYSQQPTVQLSDNWNRLEYRPLEGFVYTIAPFNFTALAGTLVSPAALLGNVVVWKPSPFAVQSAHLLHRILLEAGLPQDVIQFVTGDAEVITDTVLNRPEFAEISYIGSTAVFKKLHQKGEDLDGFFSCLMTDKTGKPNDLELGEIVSEVSVIINASADTVAIALSHIMELLIRHPQHLQRLRAEIDEALEEDDFVAPYDKVKDLPFLRACLDEGLRLIPPTSAGLARRTPPEGAQILGEWIPGDTSVSMTIYSAHRDPDIFPEPEEFRLQRWLDLKERKRMERYFIPFSTGAQGCIGRNISYLEQTIMVASLVHRYEFALPSSPWTLQRHEAFNILVREIQMKI